jgi:hypothetical protein
MRKFAILGLLSSIAMSGVVPVAAQSKIDGGAKQMFARAGYFDSVRAITDGNGVLVRWQMRSESGIAGYNVYRIEKDSKIKTNPYLVPGSSTGTDVAGVYGERHQSFDANGSAAAEYVIEAVRFDGTKHYSSPVPSRPIASLEAEVGVSSETLREAAMSDTPGIEQRRSDLPPALADLVAQYAQEPDPENQFVVASKPGAKIAVRADGFYRVPASQLSLANFPLTSDPANWRLFMDGVEQAIIVGPQGSYIEFYGRGVDLPETNTRYYYLIADTVPGKRIGTKLLRTVPGSPPAKNFPVVALKKERFDYYDNLRNGDEENFLGPIFMATGTRIRFNLPGVDFSAPTATIKITLFGWGDFTHHKVQPSINDYPLPEMRQFGAVHYWESFTIPTEQLNEGENILELVSDTVDTNVFNKVEVTYKRTYSADAGKLSFFTPGSRKIDLDGFDTQNVRVFDITTEGNPILLANLPVQELDTGYRVRLPASRMMVGYALEDTALLQSPLVTANVPSAWSHPANGADMLIISHSSPAFMNAAQSWATYRRSAAGGGLDAKVVSIEDVYDEFNFGLAGAAGIKNFLRHANEEWDKAPRYVMLLGDASRDPRRHAPTTVAQDLVPSAVVSLALNESSSDEALADFDDDDIADIAIGRIPARTPEQVMTAFNKTVKFETNQASFSRGVLFVHDAAPDVDSAGNTQRLSRKLEQSTSIDTFIGSSPSAAPGLIQKFNQGRFLVNYLGHGSSGIWANSGFFSQSSVELLTNRENPSFVSQFTCLTGYFSLHEYDSLSETMLFSENGGAAAAWAFTGKTTAEQQTAMGEKFFEELAGTELTRVGDIILAAKHVPDAGRDVRLTAALLGDPALKMP